MTVTAVVVTWNSAGVLEGLLDSLPSGFAGIDGLAGIDEWRLIVVDNASADETVAIAERWLREHPDVDGRILNTGRNAGYAAAINAALAHGTHPDDAAPANSMRPDNAAQADGTRPDNAALANGMRPNNAALPNGMRPNNAALADGTHPDDAALILNPDIRLGPGCVRQMSDALESDARPPTGIVVPRVRDAEGRLYRSLRREPSLPRALGEALLGRHAARFGRLGETVGDAAAYQTSTTADWATGAVMLISAACRAQCGPWDESFFLYSEETEYALRARDRGFATRLAPAAEAVHLGGESKTSGKLWALLTVNRVRLYRRRHTWPATALFWTAVVLRELPRALLGRAPSRTALAALFGLHRVVRP